MDMTENNEGRPRSLGKVAATGFGRQLAGQNVTFGAGLPFGELPAQVQAAFEEAAEDVRDALAAATPEAPPTVTVAIPGGGEIRYEAEDYALDGAALHVLAQEGKEASAFASFAHGQWTHAETGGRRAPSSLGHAASTPALEAALQEVLGVVADEKLTRDQRLAEVQATAARALRAHGAR